MRYEFKVRPEIAWLVAQAVVSAAAGYVADTHGVPTNWVVWLGGLAGVVVRPLVGGAVALFGGSSVDPEKVKTEE